MLSNEETSTEPPEDPPSCSPRPTIWQDIPDDDWNNWRWQLAHRLNSVDELAQIIHLTPEEIDRLDG